MSQTATADQVLDLVKELKANQDKLESRFNELTTNTNKSGNRDVPWARRGEDPLTSRGYSFVRAFGAMAGHVDKDHAKVEIDIVQKLRKYYDAWGYRKEMPNSVMVPFSSQLMCQPTGGDESLAREVGQVVRAGVTGYDREEVADLYARYRGVQKAMSWLDATTGESLVGPPQMGELFELLRNNEVLIPAGCRVIGMPPNGRITWPRQTSAATAYMVGESAAITDSTPGTGDVVLQAKKMGLLVKIPNELFRYASVSVEMFVRSDIAAVAGLKMDKVLLEDAGSSTTPKGLINYANINTYTATTVGANGNTFEPEDVANAVGTVESQNAEFKAFIMRPLMWSALVNRRADAVVAGDKKGPFMFNILREMEARMDLERKSVGNLYGYPVHKSTQISKARSKGGASNLTYILGGDFSRYILAMSGALEFQVSTQGDTPLVNDQTWYRGLVHFDGAPTHEAAFVLVDQLVEG